MTIPALKAFAIAVTTDGKTEILEMSIRSLRSSAEAELEYLRSRAKRIQHHWFREVTDARVVPVVVAVQGV